MMLVIVFIAVAVQASRRDRSNVWKQLLPCFDQAPRKGKSRRFYFLRRDQQTVDEEEEEEEGHRSVYDFTDSPSLASGSEDEFVPESRR